MQRHARLRKIITRVIVFVLAGAIVNVAVAWGCIASCRRAATVTSISPPEIKDAVLHWSTCLTTDATQMRGDRFAARGLLVEYYYGGPPVATPTQLLITTAGMPLAGVQGVMKNECGIRSTSGQLNGPRGAMIMRTAYPHSPIWPGFAVNTVFYAAVLGVLFLGPGMVRRAARRHRGLCPACGYPVGFSTTCTECGAAVRIKSA